MAHTDEEILQTFRWLSIETDTQRQALLRPLHIEQLVNAPPHRECYRLVLSEHTE
jgi:hypothetical protein